MPATQQHRCQQRNSQHDDRNSRELVIADGPESCNRTGEEKRQQHEKGYCHQPMIGARFTPARLPYQHAHRDEPQGNRRIADPARNKAAGQPAVKFARQQQADRRQRGQMRGEALGGRHLKIVDQAKTQVGRAARSEQAPVRPDQMGARQILIGNRYRPTGKQHP